MMMEKLLSFRMCWSNFCWFSLRTEYGLLDMFTESSSFHTCVLFFFFWPLDHLRCFAMCERCLCTPGIWFLAILLVKWWSGFHFNCTLMPSALCVEAIWSQKLLTNRTIASTCRITSWFCFHHAWVKLCYCQGRRGIVLVRYKTRNLMACMANIFSEKASLTGIPVQWHGIHHSSSLMPECKAVWPIKQ